MTVGYETAFGIGLIASVSSCLAIVGGLVLSLSANVAKEGSTWRTPALFHIGRLAGFFVLGGVIGLIGESFHLGTTAQAVLNSFVALVMLVLGVNLLDLFPSSNKFQLRMPESFRSRVTGWGTRDHALAPLLFGVGTFFLPCGFTQSMQLAALSSGSFMQGALIMSAFALGTFPTLALLSFGALTAAEHPWRRTFFRVAGVGVIALALFNIWNVLTVTGIISPRIEWRSNVAPQAVMVEGKQVIDITAKAGFSPREVVAKAGVPTILRIATQETYDCSSSIVIPKLSYQKFLQPSGTEDIEISAEQATGTLQGTCSMGMYGFQIKFQ